MMIRITKGAGWYENKVGEVHEVIRTIQGRRGNEYVVWEKGDSYNWVDASDCEVLRDSATGSTE